MRRPLLAGLAVFVAVILQDTLINRLPLPHGAVPSLVLILVAAIATSEGPMAGVVTGFCAGLALDIAPPGSYLIGEYALVYCLTGFACGRIGRTAEGQAVPTVLIAAAGAAAGEAVSALIGVGLSDPEVTWIAVKHALPFAVLYDVLLTPFACGLVRVLRPAPAADGTLSPREPVWAPRKFGATPSALRLVGGSVPRLGLAGMTTPFVRPTATRQSEPRLRLAGAISPAIQPRVPRRETKVHFSAGKAATGHKPSRPVHTPKFGERKTGRLAALLRQRPPHQAKPGKGWLNAGKPVRKRPRRTPGKGWLTSKPARRMARNRKASKNWVRSSRRRRVLSRLGGWR